VISQASTDTALVLNLQRDSPSMIFEPQPRPSLSDTGWQAQSYNNARGGVTSLLPDTAITALFGSDGTIAGDSGCNAYLGTYTVDGESLGIADVGTTPRACDAAIDGQEQAYLAAL
jgi:heat shock protein HslJ